MGYGARVEVGGAQLRRRPLGATMLADLDLLLTAVFCAADDLLPKRARNARRRITDAEVVTLCVAQAILWISSDRQFLRAARRQLSELFPLLPTQDAFGKRRARLAEHIEALMATFARDCPGYYDEIVLLDSTPVECGRSVDTARRSQLAPACAHHYSRSHSRWFWGMRLHLLGAPDGTNPRGHPRLRRRQRTRRRAPPGRAGTPRRRDDHLRQGLRRARVRRTRRRALRRQRSAPGTQRRARQRPAPRGHPPAHREHLLDPQRSPRPGGTPSAHPARAARPDRLQTPRLQRRHLAQLAPRPAQPHLRRPHRLTRGINHLVS
jgi:hypothetical protein